MGIEVPKGDEPSKAEQAVVAEEAKEPSQEMRTGGSKSLWLIVLMAVVIVAAVLIGVLPDWGDDDDDDIEDPFNGTQVEQLFFESTKGPFDAKLSLFSSRLTDGYDVEDEAFTQDLEQLAKILLNDAINSNSNAGMRKDEFDGEFTADFGQTGAPVGAPVPLPVSAPDSAPEEGLAADVADTASDGDLESATDFSTNNQEENVDKADFVKSDGTFVFAAYGDYLLVWGLDGQGVITKVQMPPIQTQTPNYPPDVILEPFEPDIALDTEGETASSGTATSTNPDELPPVEKSSIWWDPKPHIQAILIDGNRLTLVVSGYEYQNQMDLGYTPVLMGYQGSQIRVYDINGGNLELVSTTDINGNFRNAYSVGSNAYIVTHSSLNIWEHLLAPVQRWLPEFAGLDDDDYVELAATIGEDAITDFIERLKLELAADGPVDIARLSVFADALSSDNVEEGLFASGIANAITHVAAFDMGGVALGDEESFALDLSATFQPGHWGHVYATDGMIIVADQGWSWIEDDGVSAQKTYLIGFRLNGPTSTHALVGSVDGYMLNSFSLDFIERNGESFVRIATTQEFWTPWFGVPVIPEGGIEIDVAEPRPDIDVGAAPDVLPESSTLNQIIVLKIPSTDEVASSDEENTLKFVGSVPLGEPNERFTTVRFFDEFAYAVTFERTDPFYVIDLSGDVPVEAGELKIEGFSEYLHSIDKDDRFLVAVGQSANSEGFVLGLQLSLFDASDPSTPKLVDRYEVETDDQTWSGTSASFDERAFRFLPLGDGVGKVIIPISVNSWQTVDRETGLSLEKPQPFRFEGFSVFDVTKQSISKDFDIDHGSTDNFNNGQTCGYWYNWLPERSLVFSGDVMTMKGYTVMSTDLTTGKNEWGFDILDENLGCR